MVQRQFFPEAHSKLDLVLATWFLPQFANFFGLELHGLFKVPVLCVMVSMLVDGIPGLL